jgi:MFS family permease
VPLTILYKSLDGLASGIWSSGATSAYILLLLQGAAGVSPTVAIGGAQALQGVVLAAAALPMSWAADKLGRACVARFSGALALVAAALTSAAVWPTDEPNSGNSSSNSSISNANGDSSEDASARPPALASFRLLCGALAVWGAASGVSPTVDALFADSLPTGGRASWFQLAYALSLASRAVGPLLAAFLFWRGGDEWSLPTLRHVILAGQAVAVLPSLTLFFLRDDAALGEESEGMLAAAAALPSSSSARPPSAALAPGFGGGSDAGDNDNSNGAASLTEPLLAGAAAPTMEVVIEDERGNDDRAAAAAAGREDDDDDNEQEEEEEGERPRQDLCRPLLRQSHVPLILALTDLVSGLASGMTVKFTSIFFMQAVRLSPTSVNMLNALSPLLIAGASALASRAARRSGRVQTMLLSKSAGIALLFWLALDEKMWTHPWSVAGVFLARTALMNGTYPLSRSVLSDYVPKARRARWNALESVTVMSWSGSAFVGGWLIEKKGFGAAFFTTAALQGVALLGQTLLLPLVPRREGGVLAIGR